MSVTAEQLAMGDGPAAQLLQDCPALQWLLDPLDVCPTTVRGRESCV